MYDRENKTMPKDTLEKIIGSFNLLVAFDLLKGKSKKNIQKEIMKETEKTGMKAQANQDSIENLERPV